MAADNVVLGTFVLDGIPSAPRGIPQVEVSFNIDVNGILNVKATDKGTGKEQKITIQSSNLSKDDIEKMKREAEANEDIDSKKKALIEAQNEADGLVYRTEKLITDLGEKLTPEEKGSIQSKVDDVKKALEGGDPKKIDSACADLNQEVQKFSTRLYQQSSEEPKGPDSDSDGSSDTQGDTVDAEFSE